MENRTCIECGAPLVKAEGRGRWPLRCERHRRIRPPRIKPGKPATERKCQVCGVAFMSQRAVMCSQQCRSKAKYDRIKADPEAWAKYLADCRARYTPKPPRPTRTCEVPGCDAPHLARGMCRIHWRRDRRARGLDGGTPVDELGAMARRYDEATRDWLEEPRPCRLLAQVTATLVFPRCPECQNGMFAHPTSRKPLWNCLTCHLAVLLNREELEWVTSARRSTAA